MQLPVVTLERVAVVLNMNVNKSTRPKIMYNKIRNSWTIIITITISLFGWASSFSELWASIKCATETTMTTTDDDQPKMKRNENQRKLKENNVFIATHRAAVCDACEWMSEWARPAFKFMIIYLTPLDVQPSILSVCMRPAHTQFVEFCCLPLCVFTVHLNHIRFDSRHNFNSIL